MLGQNEVEDYAKELGKQYNEAVRITDKEYQEITNMMNVYNDIGDGCSIRPLYERNPYTEVCVIYEDREKGIIKLAVRFSTDIWCEKEFRKQPCVETSENFINRIKAFLYDNLGNAFSSEYYYRENKRR